MRFASECQSHLVPRNIAVRGLIGHTLVREFELGVIVDKSLLAGQDKTFAALLLRIGYHLITSAQKCTTT
jgi:hypothetical protein